MSQITFFMQLTLTFLLCMYFVAQIKNGGNTDRNLKSEYAAEAEELNRLRHIRLSEPMNEIARPSSISEIIGQDEGIRALRAALWGKYPQHIIIYGPPGVGKTAAARIILEEVKNSPESPFGSDAPFIEVDATIMRCDEYGFTDPLIGSVHDPIYQGSGIFGQNGLPQPKPGAVTRAHGGILFIDEIGELSQMQINKLLKILEDRKVILESSYYQKSNNKIPTYIRDAFDNGFPADFRLIGATTSSPDKIPEAIRSRCTEIYFASISRTDLINIIKNASVKCGVFMETGVKETIADYVYNGRDAIKIMQFASNLAKMEGRGAITVKDVRGIAELCKYKKRKDFYDGKDKKIIDISFVKPFERGQ